MPITLLSDCSFCTCTKINVFIHPFVSVASFEKNDRKICKGKIIVFTLQSQKRYGSLAEWLGAGLQNHIRRFDSARNLKERCSKEHRSFSLLFYLYFFAKLRRLLSTVDPIDNNRSELLPTGTLLIIIGRSEGFEPTFVLFCLISSFGKMSRRKNLHIAKKLYLYAS